MAFYKILKRVFILIILFSLSLYFVFFTLEHMRGFFGEKIGVIEIEGVIRDSKDILPEIERFKEDKSIKGVLLRIDSPGGASGPAQEIYSEVRKLREKKKVYASLGSLATSGAFYIASAADRIYANPSTITGSIGVIMTYMNMEELLKKVGINAENLKSGNFKDIASPLRKMREEERRYLEGILKEVHEIFIRDVAQGRRMDIAKVKSLADGRIFTGVEANRLGLVDKIGTFYDALYDMKSQLGIKGKPVLVYGRKPFSLIKFLFSDLYEDFPFKNSIYESTYLFLLR